MIKWQNQKTLDELRNKIQNLRQWSDPKGGFGKEETGRISKTFWKRCTGPGEAAELFSYAVIHSFSKHSLTGGWRSRRSQQGGSSACPHQIYIGKQNTQDKPTVTEVVLARQNVLPTGGEEDGGSLVLPLRGDASGRSSTETFAVTLSSPLYPTWLWRIHTRLELSSLLNRRPTIPSPQPGIISKTATQQLQYQA